MSAEASTSAPSNAPPDAVAGIRPDAGAARRLFNRVALPLIGLGLVWSLVALADLSSLGIMVSWENPK